MWHSFLLSARLITVVFTSFRRVFSEFPSLLDTFRKEEMALGKVLPAETLDRLRRTLYVRYLKEKRPSREQVKMLHPSIIDVMFPRQKSTRFFFCHKIMFLLRDFFIEPFFLL